VTGHDTAGGTVLWQFPWANGERINAAQPVVISDDSVLYSTGYGKGAVLFTVHQGKGAWEPGGWATAGPLWTSTHLKAKFTSPVELQGAVYGLDDGILTCIHTGNGQRLWKDGRYGHGQVLLAGDRLIVQAENGNVVLVEPSRERLIERGRLAALSSRTWNHPALAGRYLLVRNDREAACYELPE
jgi:outer membrane protein assembly factor BamB